MDRTVTTTPVDYRSPFKQVLLDELTNTLTGSVKHSDDVKNIRTAKCVYGRRKCDFSERCSRFVG